MIYTIVCIVCAFILAGLSAGKRGRGWAFVDVALCTLFGMWELEVNGGD